MVKDFKGFTLIETIISLGLIFIIVFAVSALALGYSRYQTERLERSLVQENFRYVVSIISEEVQQAAWENILIPQDKEISSELHLQGENNTIIRYHIVAPTDGGTESQVWRTVYDTDNKIIEDEPVSDKIKAISHLLFTAREGVTIFITGKTANGTIVTYVSQVFPRNQ